MQTTPIVNGHALAIHRLFGAVFASKGESFADLSGTPNECRTITAFDSWDIGDVVP